MFLKAALSFKEGFATRTLSEFGREPLLLVLKFQLNPGHPPGLFSKLVSLVNPAGAVAARVVYSLQKGTTSEMKRILLIALLLSGLMPAVAQVKKEDLATKNTASPGAETSVTVNGKNIWIYYHAPY